MKRCFASGAIGLFLVVAACGPKNSLLGTWSASNMPGAPPGSVAKITYREPDKLSINFEIRQDGGGVKFTMFMAVSGTYKVSGNRIVHKVDTLDFKIEGLDEPTTKRVLQALEPKRQEMLADMNREPDQTFEWKSSDELVFKNKTGDTILKRET